MTSAPGVPVPVSRGGMERSSCSTTVTRPLTVFGVSVNPRRPFRPTSFNAVQGIGDDFKSGMTVDLVLEDLSDFDARRIVDFSAGLVHAMGGEMQEIEPKHFRLVPKSGPGTSDDLEPSQPRPSAGSGAAAVAIPESG